MLDIDYLDYMLGDYGEEDYPTGPFGSSRLSDVIHRIDLVDIFSHNLAAIVPPFDYEPYE